MGGIVLPSLDAQGGRATCDLEAMRSRNHQDYALAVASTPIGEGTFHGPDLFTCLFRLRRFLVERGWRILCQGARPDAWASGMARDMGAGLKVYIMTPDDPNGWNHLVRTFDEATEAEVGTLEEQRACPRIEHDARYYGGRSSSAPSVAG
jgi:hypothetical protein